jgi:hypothetical protein
MGVTTRSRANGSWVGTVDGMYTLDSGAHTDEVFEGYMTTTTSATMP